MFGSGGSINSTRLREMDGLGSWYMGPCMSDSPVNMCRSGQMLLLYEGSFMTSARQSGFLCAGVSVQVFTQQKRD